jgi:hypothetical protein
MSRTPTTPPSNRPVQWRGDKVAFSAPAVQSQASNIPELRARAAQTVGLSNEKIRVAQLTLRQCGPNTTDDPRPLRATTDSSTAMRLISAARASLSGIPATPTTGKRMRNSLMLSQLQATVGPVK